MARKYVDCREVPSEMNCTVGIAADSEEELVEAAAQHAVGVHSHEDTPELRSMVRRRSRRPKPPRCSEGARRFRDGLRRVGAQEKR
jgi:predicted small metal-binding protein